MSLFRYLFLSFLCVMIVAGSQNAFAGSGAFRLEVPDTGAFGKGSAFVGEANTPAAVYYNPAGLSQMTASAVSVGATIIAPQVDYKNFAGDKTQMRRNTFTIPHLYYAAPVSEKLAIGLGATSYFGLGTEWAEDSNVRYSATNSDIENKDLMLTAAYKLNDQWSFAVSADNDDTKANKNKKLQQASGVDGNFQLKAKDNAWGYRLATMYKMNERHQFGLMYRSRISHKYEGKAYLNNLDSSATLAGMGLSSNSYQGLFGASYETKLTEKFTLPQSIIIGYSFKPTAKWTLNADLEWMDWSSVKREALNWTDETDASRLAILNNGNPANRDWKSVLSFQLGAEYAATDRLRLRGGYYHHDSPVPDVNWVPNLPDAASHGVTTGLGYDLNKNLTLDLAYSFMLFEHRTIDNSSGTTYSFNGTYKQIINMASMSLTYKF